MLVIWSSRRSEEACQEMRRFSPSDPHPCMHHGPDSTLSYPCLSKRYVLCPILRAPFRDTFPQPAISPTSVAAAEDLTNKVTEARSTITFQLKMVQCVVVTVGHAKIMPTTISECLSRYKSRPFARYALSHSFVHFFVASALFRRSPPQKPFRVSRTGGRQ